MINSVQKMSSSKLSSHFLILVKLDQTKPQPNPAQQQKPPNGFLFSFNK